MIAVGHETVVRRFRDELGPNTRVVVTVQSFSSVLPSLLQQYVRSGHQRNFKEFLGRWLNTESAEPSPDMLRHDQGAIVRR